MGFQGGSNAKEPACQCRRHKRCRFNPWVGKIPWKRAWQATPVFLLDNPMDQGAWSATLCGVTELVTTEVTEHRYANLLKTKTPENLENCAELHYVLASIRHTLGGNKQCLVSLELFHMSSCLAWSVSPWLTYSWFLVSLFGSLSLPNPLDVSPGFRVTHFSSHLAYNY